MGTLPGAEVLRYDFIVRPERWLLARPVRRAFQGLVTLIEVLSCHFTGERLRLLVLNELAGKWQNWAWNSSF